MESDEVQTSPPPPPRKNNLLSERVFASGAFKHVACTHCILVALGNPSNPVPRPFAHTPYLFEAALRGRTVGRARCAKSRLFPTTGSHGSQGPEFCTPCCFELIMHASVGGWFAGVFPG